MSERMWIPADYLDEVMPPPTASPDDWIYRVPGDVYALKPGDYLADAAPPRILCDGDIVEFEWTEDFGAAVFCIDEAGNWSVDRQPPPETTHVCECGDPDTLAYGHHGAEALAEFAEQFRGEVPDETTIHYYTWSESPTKFRFQAGKFTAVEGTLA
jgi:hypothetical protein